MGTGGVGVEAGAVEGAIVSGVATEGGLEVGGSGFEEVEASGIEIEGGAVEELDCADPASSASVGSLFTRSPVSTSPFDEASLDSFAADKPSSELL